MGAVPPKRHGLIAGEVGFSCGRSPGTCIRDPLFVRMSTCRFVGTDPVRLLDECLRKCTAQNEWPYAGGVACRPRRNAKQCDAGGS